MIQEALTNVVKHAHASTVRLVVDEADETIAIEVRDDGVGFAPGSAVDGFGLAGMRERVQPTAGSRSTLARRAPSCARACQLGRRSGMRAASTPPAATLRRRPSPASAAPVPRRRGRARAGGSRAAA
ncbi:MAG: ATP-binding protein [Solirubrobacteraceae bacterium]